MSDTVRTVLVKITGRVQGVWFRDWTKRQADKHNLSGWVRNRSDASVEALFHGRSQDIEDMIRTCHKGSPLSLVDDVKLTEQDSADFQGFEIRETD